MQFIDITIGNLQPVFKTFMEAYESWNETRGFDPIKRNYTIFIEKWKYYYATLNEVEDAQSVLSCIKEMKLLLEEIIPKIETFQKERFHSVKRVSEAHTSLIDSMKQYFQSMEIHLTKHEILKETMELHSCYKIQVK